MQLNTIKSRNQNQRYFKLIEKENILKNKLKKLKEQKQNIAYKIGIEKINVI